MFTLNHYEQQLISVLGADPSTEFSSFTLKYMGRWSAMNITSLQVNFVHRIHINKCD
jgi:hypothetical protein